jgi:NADH-quinone oxidoreductase subunit M
MSSIGLPLLNGFVGEFMIMVGMWTSTAISYPWITTMIAGTGVIFAAVYLLWMIQRVFFGKLSNEKNKGLTDLTWRELGLIAPLVFLMVFMGVYPSPFLDKTRDSVVAIQERVVGKPKAPAAPAVATKSTEAVR